MLAELLSALFPGVRLLLTESGEAALHLLGRSRPGVMILDLHLTGMHGFEFAERARAAAMPPPPIVALTGDMSPDTLMRAEALGFAAFLRKPASMERLDAVLRPMLETSV